ncbi:MAG: hypothetical protein QM537_01725 [Candidatus Symbiobacter sp.]|nr:hypothetical protein [Candidatus Symbiobacter sp.]
MVSKINFKYFFFWSISLSISIFMGIFITPDYEGILKLIEVIVTIISILVTLVVILIPLLLNQILNSNRTWEKIDRAKLQFESLFSKIKFLLYLYIITLIMSVFIVILPSHFINKNEYISSIFVVLSVFSLLLSLALPVLLIRSQKIQINLRHSQLMPKILKDQLNKK